MTDKRWVFLPGITGLNSGLRCVNWDERFDVRDLPWAWSARKAAERIAESIRGTDTDSIITIGNSYGSLVALHLAEMLPDVCRGTVLVNPPSRDGVLSCLGMYVRALRLPFLNLSRILPGQLKERISTALLSSDSIGQLLRSNPELLEQHRHAVWAGVWSVHLMVVRALEVLGTDMDRMIAGCSTPILIIRSERETMPHRSVPGDCEEVIIGGADHFPLTSRLQECVSTIENWAESRML